MEEKTTTGDGIITSESVPASSEPAASEGTQASISQDIINESNAVGEAIKLVETKKAVDELKKILEETKRERARIEKAAAEILVNGKSYAGQETAKVETDEEKWAREAKIRYAGTGMDPTPKTI